jgi:hypothetical protein
MKESKNVISNSSVQVGGNLHIGDIINLHLNRELSTTETTFSKNDADKIKQLIGKGEMEQGINLLLSYAKGINNRIFNEIISIARQWEDLQRETRIGLLSTDEKFRLASKITHSLLSATDNLRNEFPEK